MRLSVLQSQTKELREKMEASKKLPEITAFMDTYAEIANKAAQVLGYQPLSAVASAPLKRALLELGIEIFDTVLVEEYKTQIVALKTKESGFWGDRTWFWREKGIYDYQEPIPTFVLNKAIQIKEKLPEARICIHYLVHENPYPDPFISVSCFGEQYYFEVWDEPKFEGRIR